ncbi:MAG: hypothetical protein MRJ65_08380 [Candidatus Brocadiaceae bacterium]|nr:hypothetical protein [Candidatus Brocadiaceae bacterium]
MIPTVAHTMPRYRLSGTFLYTGPSTITTYKQIVLTTEKKTDTEAIRRGISEVTSDYPNSHERKRDKKDFWGTVLT